MSRAANRPKRTPLGVRTNVLTAKARPGFQRRWVNDVDDRLQRALDGSYDFVRDSSQNDSAEGVARDPKDGAVRKSVGNGVMAYLMEIPDNFYQEDQANKAREVSARERASRPKGISGPQHGGSYGEISIQQGSNSSRMQGDLSA